ncbi:DUF2637 domain-containing protein [Nocardia tengchongensis]|uniref:DUF2637 domain-containing protein n=1 Tax=Nocardia tengchongensis TaxID=2055889 RepID=UPI003655B6F2
MTTTIPSLDHTDNHHATHPAAPAPAGEPDLTQEALNKARTFWWWVLGCSAFVGVIGNALDAYLRVQSARPELIHPKPGLTITLLPPLAAAVLAALVPIALVVHTHGLALLLQAPSKHGWLSRAFIVAIILLLGVGGFVLSFAAMTELAMMAGIDAKLAWLYSVLVDGSIAGSTIALLSLPPTAATPIAAETTGENRFGGDDSKSPDVDTEAQVIALSTYEFQTDLRPQEHLTAAMDPGVSALELAAEPEGTEAPAEVLSTHWDEVASDLCENTRRDHGQVAKVLHLSFDRGLEATEIANAVGMRERAVRSLLEDAQPYHLIARENIARAS